MRNRIVGNGGLLIAILMACALSALDFFVGHPQDLEGMLGICLPSPNLWPIPDIASWITNLVLLVVLGIALQFFNKTYNFISSSDTVFPAAFIFLCGSNPWISGLLTSSLILMGANLLCLNLLFNCYRSPKGQVELFTVGVLLALGSMTEYGFIFMIPVYLLIAATLKCLHFKSFIAYLMGLITPYWIGIGFGIIPLDILSYPSITNLFEDFATKQSLLIGLLNGAVTILMLVILVLSNAVKLYAGNTRRRLMNNSLVILGFAVSICMICDADNITAYFATLYFVVAAQLANFFVLHNVRHPGTLIFVFVALYLVAYFFMISGYLPVIL
ncbi:MAG: hypothetical protein HDS89_03280 [Bacteroidales bacterium]|nr:hypothetical protein [Bacteroidales bacterium]